MKKDIFDFGRFWNYFQYDLKQMWRNHSKPALFIGGMELILYVVWVLIALVFTGHWTGPVLAARIALLTVAFTILELYQTRTYGYLTDRQKGSAWLMIPASRLEKYVSMMLITLIVIPVLFIVVYLCVDALLALVDPTVGKSILGVAFGGFQELGDFVRISGAPVDIFSMGWFCTYWIVGIFCNFLYFLLCGISFKRYKILGGIAILFGFSILLSIVAGTTVPTWSENLVTMSEAEATGVVTNLVNWFFWIMVVITVGLGAGVYFRIKNIKH